ncbi:phage major capsid protein [Sphingomonas sp. CGMCC 1.13654]|uniref:Phage major capsid protein n=1 Tax=Sphingomonas chungangi TaxID=2683589 RepID=A0A838L5W5_9SPHN|nr:phage major capsid protein [Sphingomonas chungangi]MVW56598.1 phage major capsid protein [Sphingomonas chungangi]
MYETKNDPLEASFAGADDIAELRAGMAALKAKLDAGTIVAARAPLSGAAAPEAKQFVDRYLRHGNAAGIEVKAIDGTADSTGGYAVPQEIDAAIASTLSNISPIRGIANVVTVGSAGYRKLVTSGGITSGWAAEDAARAETATPVFNEIAPPMGDLFANPAATQAMLDDAAFDLEGWLAGEIAQEFARAEGAAFVNGDGVNKPKGFLQVPHTSQVDGVRPFGTIQYLYTGVDGAFPADEPEDLLIDLVQSLRAPYRQGAVFVMNAATLAVIRKMKTTEGQFLWSPGLVTGQPDTLLGYPVVEAGDMPDIGPGTTPIAFGNFNAGYLIAERGETAILRDPFSHKPFVHFYATRRIGGAVANSEAIKLIRFSAS